MPGSLPLVYIAGPLHSSGIELENCRRAILQAERLLSLGFAVVVPHFTALWHFASPHDPQYFILNDIEILARCDALFRLPGVSRGSDEEVAYALAHGIPVFHDELKLLEWAIASGRQKGAGSR